MEMLNYDIGGGTLVKNATAITFIGWVAKKMNNVASGSPMMNELTMLVTAPVMGKLSDTEKVRILKKLEAIGVTL